MLSPGRHHAGFTIETAADASIGREQLAQLLAIEPLNALASIELVFRVTCSFEAPSNLLWTTALQADGLIAVSTCLRLLANSKTLLAQAVSNEKGSSRLLRRLQSLLVSGMKATLLLYKRGARPYGMPDDPYWNLAEHTGGRGSLCFTLLAPQRTHFGDACSIHEYQP